MVETSEIIHTNLEQNQHSSSDELLQSLIENPELLPVLKQSSIKEPGIPLSELLYRLIKKSDINNVEPPPELNNLSGADIVKQIIIPNFKKIHAKAFEQGDGTSKFSTQQGRDEYRKQKGFLYHGLTIIQGQTDREMMDSKYKNILTTIENGNFPDDHPLKKLLTASIPTNRDGNPRYRPKRGQFFVSIDALEDIPNEAILTIYGETKLKEDTRGTNFAICVELSEDICGYILQEMKNKPKSKEIIKELLFNESLKIGNRYKFGEDFDSDPFQLSGVEEAFERLSSGNYKQTTIFSNR